MSRVRESLWALLIALDILACTLWLGILYPLRLADKPTGRELISSYVGAAVLGGMTWAKWAAWVIDHLAMLLGDGPYHCVRTYLRHKDN